MSTSHGTWVPAAVAAALVATTAVAGTGPTFAAPGGRVVPTTVSDVRYSLTPRATLSSVAFAVDPEGASEVRVSLDGRTWRRCALERGRATCALGGMQISGFQTLRVVAVA
jgi:hypothetical protein